MTSKHPLPDAALDGRICLVGISGSGKSTTAKGGVERLLDNDRRVCIVDLLDGWWGLRLKRDGKSPAFPVAIFGGQHGDLPLTEHAGALIGQAVAQSEGSTIVSLSELDGDAARRRFALAFFDALHKANRAPLHLVIDECDFYSPQQPVKDGPGPLLLNRVKEIAARGRMRGFRCWTVTQRPAKLHKDVLSQADTLVAMQLTSSQDRDAIEGWIGDQGDKAAGRAILASLPSLKLGQGVLWSPRIGVLETVHFPLPATYDSSRTPEYGEKVGAVELKPIDLGALREKMGKVEAEAKANDPAALRKRIRELETEVARKPAVAVDPQAIEAARLAGWNEGHAAGIGDANKRDAGNMREITRRLYEVHQFVDMLAHEHDKGMAVGAEIRRFQRVDIPHTPMAAPPAAPDRPVSLPPPPPRQEGGEGLSKGERAVLTVLAQFAPKAIPPKRAAAIAGYSVRASTWRGILARLRQRDAITGSELLGITPAGSAVLGPFTPLPTGPALLQHWIAELPKGQAETLKVLAAIGGQGSASDVATRAGYSTAASTWRGILAGLRNLDLIDGSRVLKLHEDLR